MNPTRLLPAAAWGHTRRVSAECGSGEHLHSTARIRPNKGRVRMRVLSAEKRQVVLHLLIEGNSIRSTERLTRIHRDTIMRYLVFAGNYAGDFLYRRMRGLKLRHIEVDEIWTFVAKKQ